MAPVEIGPADENNISKVSIVYPEVKVGEVKLPFAFAPLPEEFYFPIAQIAMLWGSFENGLRDLLLAVLSANGSADLRVLHHSFESKADRLKEEMAICFCGYPRVTIYIDKIIEDAKELQTKRNLLLHGALALQARITTKGDNTPPVVHLTVEAKGRRRRQEIVETFDLKSLTSLANDLAHLTGRIGVFNGPKVALRIPGLDNWQDWFWLWGFVKKYYPDYRD